MKLGAVLNTIRSGESQFTLTWVTCDQSRKTGGQIRTMDGLKARKSEQSTLTKKKLAQSKPKKYSDTINLYHAESGTFVRVHKRLILKFNHENVTY
ncbi:MAG: hypothetical protein ACPGJS_00635 [Flammeovirgaceae bacterium]